MQTGRNASIAVSISSLECRTKIKATKKQVAISIIAITLVFAVVGATGVLWNRSSEQAQAMSAGIKQASGGAESILWSGTTPSRLHVFTASGALTVNEPIASAEYLVVDGVEQPITGYDLSPKGIIKTLNLKRPI